MKTINDIYERIAYLNKLVKNNLQQKGIVVPIQQKNGSVKIGNFYVIKNPQGFYTINNNRGSVIVENINLPQTAILIANKLALGKYLDTDILNFDRHYGYAFFDECVQFNSLKKNLSKKNFDKVDILTNKFEISKNKKNYYKKLIDTNYRKLISFR